MFQREKSKLGVQVSAWSVCLFLILMISSGAEAHSGTDTTKSNDKALEVRSAKSRLAALAWGVFVPGGAVFYAGDHSEYAAGLGIIEAASIGGFIYIHAQISSGNELAGDRTMLLVFAGITLVTKIIDVAHGWDLVEQRNASQLLHVGTTPNPQTIPRTSLQHCTTPAYFLQLHIPI